MVVVVVLYLAIIIKGAVLAVAVEINLVEELPGMVVPVEVAEFVLIIVILDRVVQLCLIQTGTISY